jgi:hypothetical protein
MIKVDRLAAGASLRVSAWPLISKFSLTLASRLQNLPANGKQGPVLEEMYQTLLSNKKQGKNYAPLKLLSQPVSHLPEDKWFFCGKLEEPLKSLKTNRNSYLGQRSIHTRQQKPYPNPSGDPVPLKGMYKGVCSFLRANAPLAMSHTNVTL